MADPSDVSRWYPPLDVRTHAVSADVAHVTVAGEIDLTNVDRFRAALAPLVADAEVRVVVCDLAAVSFFACCGLTVLLDTRMDLGARGARLRLVAASPAVVRPIQLTGLADLLPVDARLTG